MKNAENVSSPVVRTQLLTADIDAHKTGTYIEIRRVDMAANLPSGVHLHPCPVVGIILQGSILFQVEGQPGDRCQHQRLLRQVLWAAHR